VVVGAPAIPSSWIEAQSSTVLVGIRGTVYLIEICKLSPDMHILEGMDHLMFLLTLLLIVNGFWALLKTVTAFTLAHSITLALATLEDFPPARGSSLSLGTIMEQIQYAAPGQ